MSERKRYTVTIPMNVQLADLSEPLQEHAVEFDVHGDSPEDALAEVREWLRYLARESRDARGLW